jgi:hypothetical protein
MPTPNKEQQKGLTSESPLSYKSQISYDSDSKEKDIFTIGPNELDKLITKTGTTFYLCPISGCSVSNIHPEEIIRHLILKHNKDIE